MQLATSFVQVIANNALKTYGGDLAIGAMATISSISLIFLMPIFGLNQGSQPIIGYNYGAKQYSRVKETFLISLGFGTFILAIGFIVVQFFPATIISFFNSDPELMEITIRGIRIYLFMLIFVSVSIVGSNFFQSIGKARLGHCFKFTSTTYFISSAYSYLTSLDGIRWRVASSTDFRYISHYHYPHMFN